ncbi:MAG: protein-L-isoaspartate(D-aspartate) O-methyltransferase [Tomitella sp.]|nr:protein-L-isoaspartate(D-aspartate) O-methyltransferase [Tomitella sp.]
MTHSPRKQRNAMVTRLRRRGVGDERVLEAMARVPREKFIPGRLAGNAYEDEPLSIGSGQTISAPDIVAMMATALRLSGQERVLEVGGGNGYAAAVLAECAERVVTIERHAELAARAHRVLTDLGYDNVEVRNADGMLGASDRAPFDAITVAAMADEIPDALTEQLAPDGILVCPVGDDFGGDLVVLRHGVRERLSPVRFVPLVSGVEG